MPINRLVWSMDANSKPEKGFSPLSDSRGNKLAEFISAHNLFVINEDHGPTFCGSRGSSYIDTFGVKQQFQKRVELSGIALSSGAVTNSFEETINEVIFHYFPGDCENDDDDCHKRKYGVTLLSITT
ncbi:hypothetical protein TNCV_2945151 [Trichonephila clavipes]|nr:hypothetical protein TNCV_2945151 [Trichonephila clavipes]